MSKTGRCGASYCSRHYNSDEEKTLCCPECNTKVCEDCVVWVEDNIGLSKCKDCAKIDTLVLNIDTLIKIEKERAMVRVSNDIRACGGSYENYIKTRPYACCNKEQEYDRVCGRKVLDLKLLLISELNRISAKYM